MKLTDFDYFLPKELIAQYPLKNRDAARMLVVNRTSAKLGHCVFSDILKYLKAGDLLILNDTKVLPGRLIGKRATGGRVEILLLGQADGMHFNALLKPGRLKIGEKINFEGSGIVAEITGRQQVRFNSSDASAIYGIGQIPLPPYIKREPVELDKDYYQTVYADKAGAIASPTAGLHFTDSLLNDLKSSGIKIGMVTLHVGHATFKPVTSEDVLSHKMSSEEFVIPEETIALIDQAKASQKRVIAVGTTSLRVIETYALGKKSGHTDLFIYPGFKFRIADGLLTNFHLPKTTLFMLVCAFAGETLAKDAYRRAIDERYRFYSYGDAMLIL